MIAELRLRGFVRLIGRISHGFKIVPAVAAIEEIADIANGLPKLVIGSRSFGAQMRFEFREGHLDWVQVRTVGWQKQEPGSLCF